MWLDGDSSVRVGQEEPIGWIENVHYCMSVALHCGCSYSPHQAHFRLLQLRIANWTSYDAGNGGWTRRGDDSQNPVKSRLDAPEKAVWNLASIFARKAGKCLNLLSNESRRSRGLNPSKSCKILLWRIPKPPMSKSGISIDISWITVRTYFGFR